MPLYVSFLIGQDFQAEAYAKLLLQVPEVNLMKLYHQSNYGYFSESMCRLLFHCVPRIAIYDVYLKNGGADRGQALFEKGNWQLLRDNINFEKDVLNNEEGRQMEVLKWLHVKNDGQRGKMEDLLGFYNELARKMMLEGRFQSASYLLDQFLKQNLSSQDKQSLSHLEVKA